MGWLDIFYPSLLICGMVGIVFLVSVVSSYLWLTWVNKQATKCPECGKTGAGELIESKEINSRIRTEWRTRKSLFRQDTRPIRVKEETHEDHYKCQYCGHQWIKTAQWTQTIPEKKRSPVDTT